MNRYPNFSLTLLLACILLPPFALTYYFGIEPYPAILLPSGAGKVDLRAREFRIKRTSFWGKDEKNDVWTRVDVKTFLAPIPVQYFNPIAKNSFGLNPAKGKIKKLTPNEVQTAKQWLRRKLVQSGCTSDELMITVEQLSFDIKTRQIITSKRTYEEILRLD